MQAMEDDWAEDEVDMPSLGNLKHWIGVARGKHTLDYIEVYTVIQRVGDKDRKVVWDTPLFEGEWIFFKVRHKAQKAIGRVLLYLDHLEQRHHDAKQ